MTNWDYPITSHTVAAVAAAEPLPLMAAVRGVQAGLAERFPCSGCALSVHFPLIKTKTKLVRLHAAATTTATAQHSSNLSLKPIRLHSDSDSDSASAVLRLGIGIGATACGHYIIQLISLKFFQATFRCRFGIIRCSELALLGCSIGSRLAPGQKTPSKESSSRVN